MTTELQKESQLAELEETVLAPTLDGGAVVFVVILVLF